MKIELFEMAEKLQRDIQSLKRIIKDVEKESHWISLTSACFENECFSSDFCESLLEFAKDKLNEYEKEFNNL